jgi:hypothetical protein
VTSVPIRVLAMACAVLACGCANLSHRLAPDVPPPRVVAVLPLTGSAPASDLELLRAMLRSRLEVRNVAVLDDAWVDQVLSRHGWLGDAATFDPGRVPLVEACQALGAEGIVTGQGFANSNTDLLLYYRRGFGGELRWNARDGREYWRASTTATRTGGLLLKSGQIFSAIGDYADKGSSLANLQLIEAFLDEVLDTLPSYPIEGIAAPPVLAVESVRAQEPRAGTNGVVVDVAATPGAIVRVDLGDVRGVPAFEREPGRYRAIHEPPPGHAAGQPAGVTVRDPFGHEKAFPADDAKEGSR